MTISLYCKDVLRSSSSDFCPFHLNACPVGSVHTTRGSGDPSAFLSCSYSWELRTIVHDLRYTSMSVDMRPSMHLQSHSVWWKCADFGGIVVNGMIVNSFEVEIDSFFFLKKKKVRSLCVVKVVLTPVIPCPNAGIIGVYADTQLWEECWSPTDNTHSRQIKIKYIF